LPLGSTAAMAHKEDEAMNIMAYFDESGSHADASVTAMAGYVAAETQWLRFNAQVGKLFAQFGVREFHLVDLRHSRGNFAGWSVDRKIETGKDRDDAN
jgi:hypothetical protein